MSRLLTIYAMRFAGCFIAAFTTLCNFSREAHAAQPATYTCSGGNGTVLIPYWSTGNYSTLPVLISYSDASKYLGGVGGGAPSPFSSRYCNTSYPCGPSTSSNRFGYQGFTYNNTVTNIKGVCTESGILVEVGALEARNVFVSGINAPASLPTGGSLSGYIIAPQGITIINNTSFFTNYTDIVVYANSIGGACPVPGGGFNPFSGYLTGFNGCSIGSCKAVSGASFPSTQTNLCCPKPPNNEVVKRSNNTTDQGCYIMSGKTYTDSNGDTYKYDTNCQYVY